MSNTITIPAADLTAFNAFAKIDNLSPFDTWVTLNEEASYAYPMEAYMESPAGFWKSTTANAAQLNLWMTAEEAIAQHWKEAELNQTTSLGDTVSYATGEVLNASDLLFLLEGTLDLLELSEYEAYEIEMLIKHIYAILPTIINA